VVSEARAAEVRRVTGQEISGYRRVLDSGDIRHVLQTHGDRTREASRRPQQAAITRTDFARIRQIAEVGQVQHTRRTTIRNAPTIVYTDRIGRFEYTYVEQVRHRARDVALKTMWKRRI